MQLSPKIEHQDSSILDLTKPVFMIAKEQKPSNNIVYVMTDWFGYFTTLSKRADRLLQWIWARSCPAFFEQMDCEDVRYI